MVFVETFILAKAQFFPLILRRTTTTTNNYYIAAQNIPKNKNPTQNVGIDIGQTVEREERIGWQTDRQTWTCGGHSLGNGPLSHSPLLQCNRYVYRCSTLIRSSATHRSSYHESFCQRNAHCGSISSIHIHLLFAIRNSDPIPC